MEDNDLDEARKRQTFYQSLVMEGKVMADIRMYNLRKVLPFSIAYKPYAFNPTYASMRMRLQAKDTRGQYRADMIMIFFAAIALLFILVPIYTVFVYKVNNLHDNAVTFLIALLFLLLFTYGLFERRYAEHARYKIFTDPTFYRKAMDAEGAVRLFWVLQESVVPDTYTLRDFPRISGHIQNEDVNFVITKVTVLKTAFAANPNILSLFKEASEKGYIFSTVTFDAAQRSGYDFLSTEDHIFQQDVTDLFTADMHFFDMMHSLYLDTFAITKGTGKQQQVLTFLNT